MKPTLFVSDLHLSAERAAINRAFFAFLAGPAMASRALYVLGDLFEYWAGDDDDDAFHAEVVDALRGLTRGGVELWLMHGNRDFLIGKDFAAKTGVILIEDPCLIELYGVPTLLMHGDTLCTLDVDYLRFRGTVRDPQWQKQFLARPLDERRRIIAGLRADNAEEKKRKTEAVMDAAPLGIEAALRAHGYPRLIHGHTHRPALHHHTVDGRRCERWVLADWYKTASYLQCDAAGCRVAHLSAA
jgi:UDP-2,3-diacylglucosamine hydrolase